MKEFSVDAFRDAIYESLLNSPLFPYMKDSERDRQKHSKRQPLHLKDAIRQQGTMKTSGGDMTSIFEIGSPILENTHPYYHILQQAPVIRKKDKGTKKTKGSEMYEKDVGKRDYEKVYWNGKTFTKEYTRNVRGSRNRTNKVSHWNNGEFVNRESNAYVNIHYKYIDTILDDIMPILAVEFGLKMKRKQDSGLIDEFADQQGTSIDKVLDAFSSFM